LLAERLRVIAEVATEPVTAAELVGLMEDDWREDALDSLSTQAETQL